MKALFKSIVELAENAAISWIVNCGIVYLAARCFGVPMTLRIATGIWLVQCFIRSTIKKQEAK